MSNDMETLTLSDEQLDMVVGGNAFPPINVNPQVNVNAPVNVSAIGEGNVVLWSTVSNSTIGKTSVDQSSPTTQINKFFA